MTVVTRPQPTSGEIARGVTLEGPYLEGLFALADGDITDVIDVLRGLCHAHMAGDLQPPLPSVRARQIEDTIRFADSNDIDAVNQDAARLLLAVTIEVGAERRYG